MIGSLITSQTRIKILKKFFLNSNTRAHLRGLESEFGESTNAIRIELNRLESAGLLSSFFLGNKKLYQANMKHPLFNEIHNIVLKDFGLDKVVEKIIHRIGNLIYVYLIGDFARGKDSSVIELLLVGNDIDNEYLIRKIAQVEEYIGRKLVYTIHTENEIKERLRIFESSEVLLLWSNGTKKI